MTFKNRTGGLPQLEAGAHLDDAGELIRRGYCVIFYTTRHRKARKLKTSSAQLKASPCLDGVGELFAKRVDRFVRRQLEEVHARGGGGQSPLLWIAVIAD